MVFKIGCRVVITYTLQSILDIRVWDKVEDVCLVLKECPVYMNNGVFIREIVVTDDNIISLSVVLNVYLNANESLIEYVC